MLVRGYETHYQVTLEKVPAVINMFKRELKTIVFKEQCDFSQRNFKLVELLKNEIESTANWPKRPWPFP